jgi:hypothetical protein
MLEDQEDPKTDNRPGEMREACVARTTAGRSDHNTLIPRWDFAFSV